ncbi:hypothetical protein NDN08_005853 [Rhodosorus marinus]|uniref:C2H2-type domain-containing protein n=1 Tax=Rhodosorus marinus TaxID=101924 RepID=A0AAV8V3X6_9RHOD|nr:hypothetical protein NDN08_005853 [Rhodosorus marinus]
MDLLALLTEGTEVSAISGDSMYAANAHLSGMSDDGDSPKEKPRGFTDATKLGIKKRKTVACESEKPHFCPKCFSTFQSKFNLRMHTRAVHEHDKAYRCDQCSYACTTKGTLRRHMRMVHLHERPHSCSECGKCFATKSCILRHMKARHKETE